MPLAAAAAGGAATDRLVLVGSVFSVHGLLAGEKLCAAVAAYLRVRACAAVPAPATTAGQLRRRWRKAAKRLL